MSYRYAHKRIEIMSHARRNIKRQSSSKNSKKVYICVMCKWVVLHTHTSLPPNPTKLSIKKYFNYFVFLKKTRFADFYDQNASNKQITFCLRLFLCRKSLQITFLTKSKTINILRNLNKIVRLLLFRVRTCVLCIYRCVYT